ncbi:hypothetical protein C8R45DRAFT_984893 [Mycena sanguinolenta]|nr:hypothetical protein C8R45DRAFT_984893 [Mycena sanguinolenta]
MAQQSVRAAAQSLRNVHSSAVRAAAAVDIDVVVLPPMFDIFDVPVRLRRTPSSAGEQPARPQSSPSRHAFTLTPTRSPTTSTSLPHPLVFDGPAGRRPVVRRHHDTGVAAYAPQHGSEPMVTIFDGPAHCGGRRQYAQSGLKSVRVVSRIVGSSILTRLKRRHQTVGHSTWPWAQRLRPWSPLPSHNHDQNVCHRRFYSLQEAY